VDGWLEKLNFGGHFGSVVCRGDAPRIKPAPDLYLEAAKRLGLTVKPDSRPEEGSYYRSDHFSLAKTGIPAFSVKMGSDLTGKPAEFSTEYFQKYNARNYHQPSDEYREEWDFSGMVHAARFGLLIGLNAANHESMFTWRPADEFLGARIASGVR